MEESINPSMSSKDQKLARLLLGFHPNHLQYQPHNFIIDGFERRDNGVTAVVIEYRIGESNSIKTLDNTRTHGFSLEEFKDSINIIMDFLDIEGTYQKEGDGAELYNLLDNPNRNINWVYKKIKDFRRKGHDIIKANKRENVLNSEVGQAALEEYHSMIKEGEKDIRVETFGGQNRSTCHYMKYVLHGETDDISIRFFYQFGDREEYEGKFVLKDHRTKNYVVLNTAVAIHMIGTMQLQDQYRVISFPDRNKYIKLRIDGYFQDGERIGKGNRTVILDSEKNTGQGASPKMLKRNKQKQRDANAPEELKIAKEEIKKLKKELKEFESNFGAPVSDYIDAYHTQCKRASSIISPAQEYHEGIDITLDDIIDPKTQRILEELQADKPTLEDIIEKEVDLYHDAAKAIRETNPSNELRHYQSFHFKLDINTFISNHLRGMNNEADAVNLIKDELNILITYSEIQEILVRGSVLPK